MARSMIVKHEENPSTSMLLNGFLLLAVFVMLASTFAAAFAGSEKAPPPTQEISAVR